jgi:hypothetical protein
MVCAGRDAAKYNPQIENAKAGGEKGQVEIGPVGLIGPIFVESAPP